MKPGYRLLGQGLLALLLLLGAALPALENTRAAGEAKQTHETLCGRLVFLTEYRTQQRFIGLIPCNGSRPILFDARPGELHNYYRLYDAVEDDGTRVITVEYGPISRYITKFSGYDEIESCNHCKIVASTRTPNAPMAMQLCAGYMLENGVELFPEFESTAANQEMLDALEDYGRSNELAAQCNGNAACEAEAMALETGRQLGERVQRTPERRDRLIEFLLGVVKDPAAGAVCRRFPELVRFVTAGLSQKGFAIDTLVSVSPATHLVIDPRGRRTGLLESGASVQEILGAGVAVTGLNKLVLLPGGQFYELTLRGTAPGPAALEIAVNHGDEVWLARFGNTPVTAETLGRLHLSGELPWLQYSSRGTESAPPAAPFVRLPVEEAWLATATPAPSATPSPSASTQHPPTRSNPTKESGSVSSPSATRLETTGVERRTPTPQTASTRPAAATTGQPAPTRSETDKAAPGNACPSSVGLAVLPLAVAATRRRKSTTKNARG